MVFVSPHMCGIIGMLSHINDICLAHHNVYVIDDYHEWLAGFASSWQHGPRYKNEMRLTEGIFCPVLMVCAEHLD